MFTGPVGPVEVNSYLVNFCKKAKSYPMNTNMIGFRWFSKNLCILVLWMKVASALEGLLVYDLNMSHDS